MVCFLQIKKLGEQMSLILDYFIILWCIFMVVFMAIGGFFMFRKFLKQIPKKDGMSQMDWENYYMDHTIHMWEQEEKDLLEDLVSPVPEIFRDVARQTIASKIGELALKRNKDTITRELLIEGYIIGTPKRDHRFLRKKLAENNIDVTPYEPYFELSKDDYEDNWEQRHKTNI